MEASRRKLPEKEGRRLFQQLIDCVSYCHDRVSFTETLSAIASLEFVIATSQCSVAIVKLQKVLRDWTASDIGTTGQCQCSVAIVKLPVQFFFGRMFSSSMKKGIGQQVTLEQLSEGLAFRLCVLSIPGLRR
ncbi:uncharacterized protein [Spinacia oleracea]|uniref:Uncharacterized protein isoform X2 n=1 Tax=Spinacia oleracea TaxID=3562 RepID=A0ABM3RSB8_SPIOL|nr:uncharacterized protein LOC110802633 isoform X2 [Spinacia oleracea]